MTAQNRSAEIKMVILKAKKKMHVSYSNLFQDFIRLMVTFRSNIVHRV
jgi:hypothetical protein